MSEKHTPADLYPHAYLLAKLAMVVPLLQEARDALPAITEAQRKLHNVSLSLGDRMDVAGTYSLDDWRRLHAKPGEDYVPSDLVAEVERLRGALDKINEWTFYSTEKDAAARLLTLQNIGLHARAALAATEQKGGA